MNPRCLLCGRTLRQQTKWHDKKVETKSLAGDVDMHTEHQLVLTGKYGYAGNGSFCTLRCGYRYALKLLRATEAS